MTIHKWGALAAFLLPIAIVLPAGIYLTGNSDTARGVFNYHLADFLYGPVFAASLVTMVLAVCERIGERASRRTSLALLAAVLAAGAMVAVACIRSANRQYHLHHPELHLEGNSDVLVVWTTLVAGLSGAGWHFLGWALVLLGSAGWTSRLLPRPLSVLYFLAGISSLFVYVLPQMEGQAGTFAMAIGIWQGIVFWRAGPGEGQAPEITLGPPG